MKFATGVPFLSRTPDAENLYIHWEEYFLSILKRFKDHRISLVRFKEVYAHLFLTDFSFDDLKQRYERAWIDEVDIHSDHDFRFGSIDDCYFDCKKVKYKTEGLANEARAKLNGRRILENGQYRRLTGSYQCPKCNQWHLTSETKAFKALKIKGNISNHGKKEL